MFTGFPASEWQPGRGKNEELPLTAKRTLLVGFSHEYFAGGVLVVGILGEIWLRTRLFATFVLLQ